MTQDLMERGNNVPTPATAAFFAPTLFQTLFWKPRFLVDDPVISYLPFLFWLTAASMPRRIIVIGCGYGSAHFALCQAVDKLGLDARVTGIGFWDDNAIPSVPATLSDHQDMLYDTLSDLQARPSLQEAIRSLPQGSCDLLFVDLTALPDGVSVSANDILACLSTTGIAVLHGTNDLGDRAVDEPMLEQMISARGHVRMTIDLGATVLTVDSDPVSPVRSLLDCTSNGRLNHDVDLVFRRSGQGLRRTVEAETYGRLLDASRRTLAKTRSELAQAQEQIGKVRQSAETRARELAEVQGELFQLRKSHDALLAREVYYDRLTCDLEAQRAALTQIDEARDRDRETHARETAALVRIAEELRQNSKQSEDALRAERNKLQSEKKALEQQIAAFKKSASWWITTPMRSAKLALTRSRKR